MKKFWVQTIPSISDFNFVVDSVGIKISIDDKPIVSDVFSN